MHRFDWDPRSMAFAAASLVVALACGALIAVQPSVFAVLAVVVLAMRWPTATILTAVILCQEVRPTWGSWGQQSRLLTFGHELYFTSVAGQPAVAFLVLASAVGAAIYARRMWAPSRVVALTAVLVALIAFGQGADIGTILGQESRGYLLALGAALIATTTHLQPGGWTLASKVAGLSLLGLAVAGVYVYATAGGAHDAGGRTTLFYDSALPAAAAALIVYRLAGPKMRWSASATLATTVAPAAILLLSGRRSVWVAAAIVLAVALIARSKAGRVVRAACLLAVAVAFLALSAPSLLGSISDQLGTVAASLQGQTTDVSTVGHLGDLDAGIEYAREAPIWGYGFDSRPLPGLFVQEGPLYVHNDVLQQWLRFGPVIGVATIALMLGGIVLGLRELRSRASFQSGASAAFLLIWPVCAMTAPFATTTLRWPILLGFALGVILERRELSPGSRGGATASRVSTPARLPRAAS